MVSTDDRFALCNAEGCSNKPTHSVHLRFWAKGHPRDTHPPVLSTPLVAVCDKHQQKALTDDWYGSKQRESLRAMMRSIGKAEPDFETAEVFLRPL